LAYQGAKHNIHDWLSGFWPNQAIGGKLCTTLKGQDGGLGFGPKIPSTLSGGETTCRKLKTVCRFRTPWPVDPVLKRRAMVFSSAKNGNTSKISWRMEEYFTPVPVAAIT